MVVRGAFIYVKEITTDIRVTFPYRHTSAWLLTAFRDGRSDVAEGVAIYLLLWHNTDDTFRSWFLS